MHRIFGHIKHQRRHLTGIMWNSTSKGHRVALDCARSHQAKDLTRHRVREDDPRQRRHRLAERRCLRHEHDGESESMSSQYNPTTMQCMLEYKYRACCIFDKQVIELSSLQDHPVNTAHVLVVPKKFDPSLESRSRII